MKYFYSRNLTSNPDLISVHSSCLYRPILAIHYFSLLKSTVIARVPYIWNIFSPKYSKTGYFRSIAPSQNNKCIICLSLKLLFAINATECSGIPSVLSLRYKIRREKTYVKIKEKHGFERQIHKVSITVNEILLSTILGKHCTRDNVKEGCLPFEQISLKNIFEEKSITAPLLCWRIRTSFNSNGTCELIKAWVLGLQLQTLQR